MKATRTNPTTATLSALFDLVRHPLEALHAAADLVHQTFLPELQLCCAGLPTTPTLTRAQQLAAILEDAAAPYADCDDPVPTTPRPSTVSQPLPATSDEVEALADEVPFDAPGPDVMPSAEQATHDPYADPRWNVPIPYILAPDLADCRTDRDPMDRAVTLATAGMPVRRAARECGVSESTLRSRLKRLVRS